MQMERIALNLRTELRDLRFGRPAAYVYNPLEYAWLPHAEYIHRYGVAKREIVLVGMNPGPWGMVQTGVPFGDLEMVRDWLRITGRVTRPASEHPKRPVEGFSCHRGEISGRRLWGWARKAFGTPQRFFARFFVINYCPLCFFDADGKNLTPDRLRAGNQGPLFASCDRALREAIVLLGARLVIGVGRFAEKRAREALAGRNLTIACAPHPSGANPRASRDWGGQMSATLKALGIGL
jgi:single-strand selective monofunctional uracil DNA glycosylase